MTKTRTRFGAAMRAEFPLLAPGGGGDGIAYLDNAATSQKPRAVIEATERLYTRDNANVHRGVHALSVRATREYDRARERIRLLLNAADAREVVFTKGCSEGINLVAHTISQSGGWSDPVVRDEVRLREGDVVLLTEMEHHSNIVPWQIAADRVGARVVPTPVTDAGEVDRDAYRRLLREHRVRVAAFVHVSNSLGTVNPVREMIALAHEAGAVTLVDGAQAGPHHLVDVRDLDADFYTLSCHKIYAPTGVGVLYGKRSLLEALPVYQGGGDMIRTVSFERTTYAPIPAKYEAGTPNIAGVVGLGAAVDYLVSLGEGSDDRDRLEDAMTEISGWERRLADRADVALSEIPGYRRYGTAPDRAGILSFTLEGVHPHDLGTILDGEGVAVRAGHHCCMPLMRRYGIPATTRASFALYNDEDDVERLVAGVRRAREMMA